MQNQNEAPTIRANEKKPTQKKQMKLDELIILQAQKIEKLDSIREKVISAISSGIKTKEKGAKSLNTIGVLKQKAIDLLLQYIKRNTSSTEVVNEGKEKFNKFGNNNHDLGPLELGADVNALRVLSISQIPIYLFEKYEMKIFDDQSFRSEISNLTQLYKNSLMKKYSELLSKEDNPVKSSLESLINTIDKFNTKIDSLNCSKKELGKTTHEEFGKELYPLFKSILQGISKHNRDSYGKNIESLYEKQRSKFFSTIKDAIGVESFSDGEFELEVQETAQYIKEIKMPYLFTELITTLGIIREEHLKDIKQKAQLFVGNSFEKVTNWLFENPYFLCLYIDKKLSKIKNNSHLKQKPMLSNTLEERIDLILSIDKKDKNHYQKSDSDKYYCWILSKLEQVSTDSEQSCDYISSTLEYIKSNKGNPKVTKILKDLYNKKESTRVPKTLDYLNSHEVALYMCDLEFRYGYPIALAVKLKSPKRFGEKLGRRFIKQQTALGNIPTPKELSFLELYSDEDKRSREYLKLKDIMGIMFIYAPTTIDLTKDNQSENYLLLSKALNSNKKIKQDIERNFYKNPKAGFTSGIKKRCRPKINSYNYFEGQLDFIEVMFTELLGLIDSEIGSKAHHLYEMRESKFADSLNVMEKNTYDYIVKISERLLTPYWDQTKNNPRSNFFFPKA